MEFKNTKVSADLVPVGTDQLYQGHVVKSDPVSTAELGERIALTIGHTLLVQGKNVKPMAAKRWRVTGYRRPRRAKRPNITASRPAPTENQRTLPLTVTA